MTCRPPPTDIRHPPDAPAPSDDRPVRRAARRSAPRRAGRGEEEAEEAQASRLHARRPRGNWSGTWTNPRFNTNGTLTLTVTATASTLGWTATIGGNTFGCAPPAPQSFTLTKGSGPNHWNAAGFSIAGSNAAFGDFAANYTFKGGSLTASGKNLACAPGLSFTVSGHFTAKAFTATATITLPNGGGTAITNVSLERA